ncbi:histidine kinase [Cellulomonas cellasea]|uniref:histidine kinase n=1 Tax=Cellulomonas cellasea TaxID=43670 RepID=A0A7W4UHU1_9CELL|nr:histidine kinase [Cellulomonas cellasea]MBB2924407.1 signal transduction histidine kinase [Cellulomonas cellasea]
MGLRAGTGRLVRPLTSGETVRSGVFLVIGGVVATAYLVLVVGFVQMLRTPGTPTAVGLVLAAVTAVIASTPPFLAPVRTLEVHATRTFLGVDVPVPVAEPDAATRWRGALWYGVHLVAGAAVLTAVLITVPVTAQLVLSALGVDGLTGADGLPRLTALPTAGGALDRVLWAALAVALPVVLAHLVTLCAWGLRLLAPALLGPSADERVAELERAATRLAERNRLARELHDSVGHALTVTTLQAAAAARTLDHDPEGARRSLRAIELAGRAAMADLDHVLGLLREPADAAASRAPVPDLGALDRLVAETREAGAEVVLDVDGDVATVGGATSREAYRIVQESLTNALRHAAGQRVAVHVRVGAGEVEVVVSNPAGGGARERGPGVADAGGVGTSAEVTGGSGRELSGSGQGLVGNGQGSSRVGQPHDRPAPGVDSRAHVGSGQGLVGMAERVRVLRGDLDVGERDGAWTVHATLPRERA